MVDAGGSAPVVARSDEVPTEPSRPLVFGGRYVVEGETGRGGMGCVYRARDLKLGREVALKVLAPGRHDEQQRLRFEQEARAAGSLDHPNILAVHDVGEDRGGPYIVSELLQGEPLRALLQRGPLKPDRALELALQLASALAAAHRAGIVHRDVKPENVFVTAAGRLKVLDFGIAKLLPNVRSEGSPRTDTGALIGTPAYMSPEQVRGEPADTRSDVFACGIVLYELLSGRGPFDRVRSVETAYAILHDAPPALAPSRLWRVIDRCLQKDPGARYADAGALLADLETIAHGGRAAAAAKPRWPLVVAGCLLVAALGIWAARAWLARGAWPARNTPPGLVSLAVLPLANLSGDATQEYFSDGMTEEITGKLSRLGGLAVTPRSSVNKYKGSSKDAREIGNELRVAYLVEGSVRRSGERIRVTATLVNTADAVQLWSDNIDAQLGDVFHVQEQVATRIVEALHVRLNPDEADSLRKWGTRNAEAYDEYLRGQALADRMSVQENLEAARRHFERALRVDPEFAPAMVGLAFAEVSMYRNFGGSAELLTTARTLVDRALAIDPKLPRALWASGTLRATVYDYRGAAEDFRRAIAVEPRNFALWDFLCFALGYVTPPDLDDAEQACRRSLQLNPSFAEAYYHLARVLVQQGRVKEAEQAIEYLAEQSPTSAFVPAGRFWVHLGAHRPREALAAWEKQAGQFVESGLGKSWRAMALAQAGDLDGAFAALEAALSKGYRDVAQLHEDPFFAPLRRDPRFSPLLARYGIGPARITAGVRP